MFSKLFRPRYRQRPEPMMPAPPPPSTGMSVCQEKDPELGWVTERVVNAGSFNTLRCVYCHGVVRHSKSDETQVKHVSKTDSTNCVGGSMYAGKHKMSHKPVV